MTFHTPFTVNLAVNENNGFYSTNGSAYQTFTTNGTSLVISNTTTLSVYGRDALGNTSATNTFVYKLDTTPLVLAGIMVGVLSFSLSLTNNFGTYGVQVSTNLADANGWLGLYTNPAPFTFTETHMANQYPQRYYRVKAQLNMNNLITRLWIFCATSALTVLDRITPETSGWVAGLAVLLLAAAAARAGNVGDTNNPSGLGAAIVSAYNGGDRNITINPGTYNLPYLGAASVVSLSRMINLTINAYGVTINKDGGDLWNSSTFYLYHCSKVTVTGGTLTQTTPSTYQGRIIAKGTNASGQAYVNWKIDTGYPVPPDGPLSSGLNFVDSTNHLMRLGVADYYNTAFKNQGGNIIQVNFGSTSVNSLITNDILLARANGSFKFNLVGCMNCTIQDVTMNRNGFAVIREEEVGGGGNHITNCVWSPGPRPAGATEEILCSGCADGIHSSSANPGPDMQGCTFSGLILDDCIAIHGYYQTIANATLATNKVTVDSVGDLRAGQPVRISNTTGYIVDATCTAINGLVLTLNANLSVPANSLISSPNANGAGYKIINCQVGGTRSRGILVKGDNGVIRSNIISNCGMSGISAGPEYWANESDYVYNTVIEQNRLQGNGLFNIGQAAVWIHGEGTTYGNQNTTIQSNVFIGNYSGDIDDDCGWGSLITDNSFTGFSSWPSGFPRVPVVNLNTIGNVTLANNTMLNSSGTNLLVEGNSMVTLSGNNPCSGPTTVSGGYLIGATGDSCSNSAVAVGSGATNGVKVTASGSQWVCGGLTYKSGTTWLDLDFTTVSPSTTAAPLQVNGNLALNGTLRMVVHNGAWTNTGTYPLVSYTGTLSGAVPGSAYVLPSGVTAALVNNTGGKRIDLNVTAVAAGPLPPAPAGLVATAGASQVILSWSAVAGATNYNVKRATVSGGSYTTLASPTVTSHMDTAVGAGTLYYYVVSAGNAYGESTNSAEVGAGLLVATPSLVNAGFETNTSGIVYATEVDGGYNVAGNDLAGWRNSNPAGSYANTAIAPAGGGVTTHSGNVCVVTADTDGAYQITGYQMKSGDVLTLSWWAKATCCGGTQVVKVLSAANPTDAYWSLTSLATSTAALTERGLGGAYSNYSLTYPVQSGDVGKYVGVFFASGLLNGWSAFDDFQMGVTNTNISSVVIYISSVGVNGGKVSLSVTNNAGSYVLQVSTNLGDASGWQPVVTNPAPFTFTDTNAVNQCPQRFYRVKIQ